MASAPPVMQAAPPMVEVKNIFFKAHPTINYFAEEAEADAIENDVAFQHFNRGLECSNKYGCLFLSFNNAFYLIRTSDVLNGAEGRNFEDLKKLQISNDALPMAPNIIGLSNGEDYLAVDTVRGDSGWLVIFSLAEFVNQGGSCRPFCEIRCSSSANVRVSGICWNPGDNMNNMVAINTDDGTLMLAKVNGPGSVELNKLSEMNIRSFCWSPKGKQLVVGRTNGSLSQLKLDLTLAKQIPAPEPGCLPISILWTQTTQFLVVFQKESGIDFMQLDVVKAAPPTYTNSGDIFISDTILGKSSCYFVPFVQWNAVVAMTNTASDIVVLVKESRNQNEFWIPGDIADNRRAAFLLDNYTRGVTIFSGSESGVVFSEVESYPPMPVVFLLSQRGSLSAYSIVNSSADAPLLTAKANMSVPDSIFSASRSVAKQPPPPQYQSPQTAPVAPTPSQAQFQSAPQYQTPKQSVLPTATLSFGGPGQTQLFQTPPTALPTSSQQMPLFKPTIQATFGTPPAQPIQFQGSPSQQQPLSFLSQPQAKQQTQTPKMFSAQPNQSILAKPGSGDAGQPDLRQMGTSTLPTSIDMAGLEKAVEEKRREMTTQLRKGSGGTSLKGLEDDNQCVFVISEVRKFEQSIAEFKQKTNTSRNILNELLKASFSRLEKPVLSTLNAVEDFNSDMVSTTSAQKEEVEVLKERILNHFSQLEYAKSLVERSRDPRYLECLRSRPLDPASQQKFEEISKLHNYIQNQVSECRRYFYEQNRKRDLPLDRAPSTQLIYMTLSNHSKIIRRLKVELDNIKERLGLGKHTNAFDEAEFLAVCEASYSGTKKGSTTPKQNEEDEITLSDLTAGISKVKLNRDSSRPDRKPIQFSSRKLLILSKRMSEVSVVKVKADETAWTRTPARPTKPKPTAYPATENSLSGTIGSVIKSDVSPPSFGSTYVINSDCNTPLNTGNNGMKSLLKSTVSAAKPGPSLFGSLSNPPNVQGKAAENSTIFSTKPTFSANPSGNAKTAQVPNTSFGNIIGKGFTASSASPSMQLPTLTELLATPPSVSPFTGTAGASKSSPTPSSNVANTGLPAGLNISFRGPSGLALNNKSMFGAGAFSAAFQQGEVSSTNTVTSTPTVQQTPPSVVSSSAGSGAISKPAATTESTRVNFTPPSNTHTGIIGTRPTPPSNTAAESTPSERPSFTPASGTSSMGYSASPIGADIAKFHSSLPLSFATSTATIAASLEKTATMSTGSPGSGPITSSTLSSPPFSGFSAALNLSTSEDASKSSNSNPAPVSTEASGLFSTALSFGSPASGGGTNNMFGQLKLTKEPTTAPSIVPLVSSTTSASPSTTGTQKISETLISTTTAASAPVAITSSTAPTTATGTTFGFPTAPSTTSSSSSITGGLFSTSFTSPAGTQSVFSSTSTAPSFTSPVSTIGAGLLGNAPAITTTTASGSGITGLFGASSTTPSSIFSTQSSQPPAGGLFSSPSTTATPSSTAPVGVATITTSAGMFGSPAPGFFSQLSAPSTGTTTTSAVGFMSSLNMSDTTNKASLPASTASGGLFSSSTFGNAAPSAGSIFGGSSNTFTSQTMTPGTPQTATAATTGIFGNPSTAAPSIFGGAPTFGGSSPFGSSFGGANAPAFGGGNSNVFGSAATSTSTSQSTGFGQLAQGNTASPFGSSPFGSGVQQQASLFASPQKPAASGGVFSSSFGGPATTAAGVFGSGASSFGANATGGAFSSGVSAGGVAQHGFGGFAQSPSKSPASSVFGSPPSGAPVFGGGATFGSASPFGSSFSAPAASTFGSPGASVFGGGAAAQPNTGFGSLAQQGSTSPGFGSSGFGGGTQQPAPSLFGSPQQPQQQKPTFGGQAFSSWR